jgi:uncharacterized protein with FMN-binding domain
MRRALTAAACAATLAVPTANAAERLRAVTVTKSSTSPVVGVSRWGELQVALKVQITTRTVAGKKTKSWKVTDVRFPVYPDHSQRSAYISSQALPLLKQELLQLTGSSIQLVSGATDTSYAFVDAVSSALKRAGA